jgi:2-oxoglutarate ferredoxin oxidoreductase subunit gamma
MQFHDFVDVDVLKAELKGIFSGSKEKLIPINEEALDKGYQLS